MSERKQIGRLVKLVHLAFENGRNRFFRQHDVTSSQMDLLDYLDQREQKTASQKEIVDYLNLSYATVSGLIKRLEAKEYICRKSSSQDKRANLIALTDKAEELFERCSDHMYERDMNLLRGFTREEREQFAGFLEKILENSEMDLSEWVGKRFVPPGKVRFFENGEELRNEKINCCDAYLISAFGGMWRKQRFHNDCCPGRRHNCGGNRDRGCDGERGREGD